MSTLLFIFAFLFFVSGILNIVIPIIVALKEMVYIDKRAVLLGVACIIASISNFATAIKLG